MAREYRHIEEYEKEILRMRKEGKSRQEIGDMLGFSKEQIKGFINRHNRKQRKMAAGIPIKHKGRPRKDGIEVQDRHGTEHSPCVKYDQRGEEKGKGHRRAATPQ